MLAQILFFGWLVITFIATHLPLPEDAQGIPYVDKVVHVIIYVGLALLLTLWWYQRRRLTWREVLIIFSVLAVYSTLDEGLQHFVGRTPDVRDGVADMVGVVLGVWLVQTLTVKAKKKSTHA